MDTHTAVAAHVCAQYRKESGDEKKCLVASTASPYKFIHSVMTAIDDKYAKKDEFELIDELSALSERKFRMRSKRSEMLRSDITENAIRTK